MRLIAMLLLAVSSAAFAQTTRPNILLITADDMNFDTPGFAGGEVADITPNLDRLASEGMFVRNAHVTVAVCQPSRSVLMTGRYPHHNGAEGFQPIRENVPTLGEQLHTAGYLNGIMAKVSHLAPIERFCWDTVVDANELGSGRNPKLYYERSKAFIEEAKKQGKPFFLMANSQDPHRPFSGSDGEKLRTAGDDEGAAPARRQRNRPEMFIGVTRTYSPDEVTVPGFLPDLPAVRKEMAQYYTSAHRCDESVGAVLKALKESGLDENTLVMFLSDNGISQPFAKSNCYLTSTRTPWLIRWPGKVKAGHVDETHFISGIDFMPTVLEAAGLKPVEGADGRSFLPLLLGQEAPDRDDVVTVYHETSGKNRYEMRCMQDAQFGYIYNGWSDGKMQYKSEAMSGLTFRAMQSAATTQRAIDTRVKMLVYRAPEELYDLEADPNALKNLASDPQHADRLKQMREKLAQWMEKTGDPLLEKFRRREQ
jgi:N-sulfoglucosamine sulfohydrolase